MTNMIAKKSLNNSGAKFLLVIVQERPTLKDINMLNECFNRIFKQSCASTSHRSHEPSTSLSRPGLEESIDTNIKHRY